MQLNYHLMIRKNKKNIHIYDRKSKKKYQLNTDAFAVFSQFLEYNELNRFYNELNLKIKNNKTIEKIKSTVNFGIQNNLLIDHHSKYKALVLNESLDIKTIQIELTNKCNLKCLHCYIGESKYNYLNMDDIKEIINFASYKGVENICFTGGEPLLNKNFFDIARYTYLNGMKIIVYTNGTTINDDFINFCKDYPVQLVRISIDGNEKNHDYIRNEKGLFSKSLNAIKLLKKNNIKVEVSFTLNAVNKNDIPELMSLFKDIGVKINTDIFTCEGNGLENKNTLYIDNKESSKILLSHHAVNRDFTPNFKWCGICDSFLYISSNGELKICSTINLENQDIYNFKIKEKFVGWDQTINHFRSLHKSYTCKNYDTCDLNGLCGGGCRSRAILYEGDSTAPDKFMCTLCSMANQLKSKKEVCLLC